MTMTTMTITTRLTMAITTITIRDNKEQVIPDSKQPGSPETSQLC